MRVLFLLILFIPEFVFGQTFQITEISPHKVGILEEWFEFKVAGEVDLSQYQISNGKSLPKPIDSALAGETGYYYFEKSPVSLANDGGVIQILDLAGEVISEMNYPKTKSGSTKNYDWAEIWNANEEASGPLIYRSDGDPNYIHTRGEINRKLPTDPATYQLLLSEAAPKRDQDFLEFVVPSGPEEINLKYTEFKHNGTSLFLLESDLIVSPGNLITLYLGHEFTGLVSNQEIFTDRRSGLSGGSGTVEVIGYSATSLEQTEDFVCWQDKALSKTEQARVDKNILAGHWQGPCYEISDFIENQSLARLDSDTNTSQDFADHFNGSPGQENLTQNQPPQAIITIQGNGKRVGEPPFYLNVTGENSEDPDGDKDIVSYRWWLNDKLFSEKENPAGQRVELLGEHVLKLQVTDASGAVNEVTENIFVLTGNSAPTSGSSAQFQAVLEEKLLSVSVQKEEPEIDNFFDPVLKNLDFMETLKNTESVKQNTLVLGTTEEYFPRRIKLPLIVRQRLKRNLGLIWDWREAKWAAAVGSISDGAIDRNSERFVVGFGVP